MPLYAGMPLDFQPGTRWGYSPRVGHDVVARIIEIVSGLPYDEFVRTRIFEPLGMTDTHFSLPPEKESRRVVIHGLDTAAKGWDEPTRYISASGGLSSTAADFLRFEQMLANGARCSGIASSAHSPSRQFPAIRSAISIGAKANSRAGGFATPWQSFWTRPPHRAPAARGLRLGGAFGTTTWTDPAQEITAVLMVQQGSERVLHDFEHAIREAIVD